MANASSDYFAHATTCIDPPCSIGAGAVVTKDVPEFALLVGNPARQFGWMCRCGVRLRKPSPEIACAACHARYRLDAGALLPI